MWICKKCGENDKVIAIPKREDGKTRPSIVTQGNRVRTVITLTCDMGHSQDVVVWSDIVVSAASVGSVEKLFFWKD